MATPFDTANLTPEMRDKALELWNGAKAIQTGEPEVVVYASGNVLFTWNHIPEYELEIDLIEWRTKEGSLRYFYSYSLCHEEDGGVHNQRDTLEDALSLIQEYEDLKHGGGIQ